MKIVFSILFLVAACAPYRSANEAPEPVAPIAEGDRLRVTHDARCCASPSIGILQSLSRDSLVLQSTQGSARLAIARSNIFQIQRWNTHETRMARGAGVGLLAGVGLGGLIGYSTACGHCDGDWRPFGAVYGGLFGGLAGMLIGLYIGSRYAFWQTVP